MRRWATFTAMSVLFCVGCTNAPLAGFLDLVHPSPAKPSIDRAFDDGIAPLNPPTPTPAPADGRLLSPRIGPPTGFEPPTPAPVGPTPPPFGPPAAPLGSGGVTPLKLPNT